MFNSTRDELHAKAAQEAAAARAIDINTPKLVLWPAPILSQVARPVSPAEFDSKGLLDLIEKMWRRLESTGWPQTGYGLAAQQIGVDLRVCVIQIPKDLLPPKAIDRLVVCNPRIIKASAPVPTAEGCLSTPGYFHTLKRSKQIKVQFENEHGKTHIMACVDIMAQVIQHELDHFNGITVVDKLNRQGKRACQRHMEKLTNG